MDFCAKFTALFAKVENEEDTEEEEEETLYEYAFDFILKVTKNKNY